MIEALGAIVASAAPASTAILLAAMGGLINRHAGIVNIGLEAKMLMGAFVAVLVSSETGNPYLGVLAAAATGGSLGLLFSWTITRLGANEIIAGLGLNVLVQGFIGYLLPVAFGVEGTLIPQGLVGLPALRLPVLDEVPLLGSILSNHDPLTYLSWLSVPLVALFLYRTPAGMALRATGANEEAARAAGIATLRMRDLSTLAAGVFAGLAGAQLSLAIVTLFNKNMISGRGFIALAAFYFGNARPGPTAFAAILFGVFQSASFRLQSSGLPPQIVEMLPYIVVVVSLTMVALGHERRRRHLAETALSAQGEAT